MQKVLRENKKKINLEQTYKIKSSDSNDRCMKRRKVSTS